MNFYSYSPDNGMQYHATKDEAQNAAKTSLQTEFPNDYITWGEVTERAADTGAGYALKRQDRLSYEEQHPQVIDGRMRDENDSLVLLRNIHEKDLLYHDLVLSIAVTWMNLSGKIQRFKEYNFRDVQTVLALLYEKFKVQRGGRDGNMTFFTVDRKYKLQIAIQKALDFGPELQVAEQKLLTAAKELSTAVAGDADSVQAADLETLIVSKFKRIDGKVKVSEILSLRRYKIHNVQWNEGLDIIDKAIIVTSKKQQIRLYERNEQGAYIAIPLDIATL